MSEPAHHDLLGIALRMYNRVVYCRCGDGGQSGEEFVVPADHALDACDTDGSGLAVAYVVLLDPLIVWLPDTNRYIRILDSRHLVVLDESPKEREVRRALGEIGLASSPQQENA